MPPEQPWLTALWPRIRSDLPPPPTTIVELGCGRHGGFVPALLDDGYAAIGIDPVAPEGSSYRQTEFERSDLPAAVDAVVACTSLHHVADPEEVLDRVASALAPTGVVIVVEWDWERFDSATAEWCFERLGQPELEGWLRRRRDAWTGSGQTWEDYLNGWAQEEGLHSGNRLVAELDQRFHRLVCDRGPYFFGDLAETTEADELEAISAGRIQATRIYYAGSAGGS